MTRCRLTNEHVIEAVIAVADDSFMKLVCDRSRSLICVDARSALWATMAHLGASSRSIARRFGYDHKAVCYAITRLQTNDRVCKKARRLYTAFIKAEQETRRH
jgi:hypothetical protein